MQALVLTEHWKLDVNDVPEPDLGPTDVQLSIVATGICGSDFHGFSGENGRRHPGQVMGHETVGRISAVGDAVTDQFQIGAVATVNPVISCDNCSTCAAGQQQWCADKRVIGVDPTYQSAFAERLVAPARNIVLLPDSMPIEYGALVEPLAVGWHAVRRGRCTAADTVLVIGGGPIGQACVLAAQRLGVRSVVVSEPSASRRTLVDGLGAHTIDPAAGPVLQQVGTPPTVVIDAVGNSHTLATAFACAPLGSTVVLVGMGSPELDVAAFELSTKERSVVGSFCYTAVEFADTAQWVGTAPAVLATLIDQRVSIDAAQQAFTELATGKSSASKILVMLAADQAAP